MPLQVTHERKLQQIEALKEEVRKELKASAGKSPELLKLIDSIQLLGVAYHFEREIEEALKDISMKHMVWLMIMRISQLPLWGSDY